MIKEFTDFVCELFPSITPYTKEKVKESIRQFNLENRKTNFFLSNSLNHLAQGDIIGELPFHFFTAEGEKRTFNAKALLLSNTCDSENDRTIAFAPLISIEELEEDKMAIKKNQIYRLLYFPEPLIQDSIIDFGLINSYSTELINKGLENGKVNKVASLNDLGYYLFLCKLTVHLMRPEDLEVVDTRKSSLTT